MDGFDFFYTTSQTSATAPDHAPAPRAGVDSFDLNSLVPPAENFPHLHAYGAFLQGHGEEGAGLDHGSVYPPPRAPRTLGVPLLAPGLGRGWAAPPAPRARQLHFGASSSAGGSSGGAGDGMLPWPAYGGGSSYGADGGGRGCAKVSLAGRHRTRSFSLNRGRASSRGGRGGRAARGAGHPQAPGNNYIGVDEEEGYKEEVEDLGSSGSPPNKPYLKKLRWGPLGNLDLLEQMFSSSTIDGGGAFVPGDNYGAAQEGAEDAWPKEAEEEDFQETPRSTSSSQKSSGKRSIESTTSTGESPVKKSKSPMVRYVRDLSITFKEAVQINSQEMKKRASDKEAFSVRRCQQLAFECGVEQTSEAVFAMAKMFQDPFQREFFCGNLTPELRLSYFKKWCREQGLE
ncbi:hypothetical protein PVAP13_8NG149400 [Panicum virgatum]|uniref:Uncharacterized protein n=1 Tax=Panicum virgatum TaxID=38727 RepID=A0A8T0P6Z3_PANVG|nr:hypothetical protein PVAP13_8NG149400 [Panicum virgatum]